MKYLKFAFRRETAIPMLALTFASAVCVVLVFARILWTGKIHYAFLVGNLFLAWMPLFFAVLTCEKSKRGSPWNWKLLGAALAWLLFLPNAPYIFTDLIHLTRDHYMHFWVDLALILSCALTGLVLGFLSVYLMQSLVRTHFGKWWSWLFILLVAGLSGLGISIGRFLRFNSWDVVLRPLKLSQGIGQWLTQPLAHATPVAFGALFAAFFFIAYVMLYALTHLEQATQPAAFPLSADHNP